MDKILLAIFTIGLAGLGIIVLAILAPLGYAAGGYLTGWVLVAIFPFAGEWIISGLSYLGTEVPLAALPAIGAALGFVGSFFKSTQTNKTESK